MFAIAKILNKTTCFTTKDLVEMLSAYPLCTPVCCNAEKGVTISKHVNKDDESEFYINFDECLLSDDEEDYSN